MVYREILKNLNFLKLWGAQLSSQLATHFLNFALIIRVFDLAQGTRFANMAVSLLILSFGVPSIFFALFAGSVVDHFDRKKILIFTNLSRAILVLLFLTRVVETNLAAIYVTIFFIATITQFFVPAEAATLPKLVPKKDLMSANSLFVFTLYGSFVVGYSLAGPVVANFGQNAAYWVTFAAFLLAAMLSSLLPSHLPQKKSTVKIAVMMMRVRRNLSVNTRKIFSTKKLLFPILQMTLSQAMVGVIIVLAPSLSLLILGKSLQNASTILIVPAGLGMIGGAILVGQFFKNADKIKLINFGLLAASVLLMSFAYVQKIVPIKFLSLVVALIALGLGFINALISVSAQTLLQLNSTDKTRGQIFGALNMMVNVAATLPVLFAGITADLVSPTSVLLASSILILIYLIYQISVMEKGLTEV